MNLVFLGPPGAGKGTQAKQVTRDRGYAHISTGDLLRDAVREGTELGKKARGFMDSGALVPDDLMCDLVAERLGKPDSESGWVLDGFPRTMHQADALDAVLAKSGRPLDRCIYFHIDPEILIERLTGRLTCGDCGAIYHRKFNPPTLNDKTCDQCGGELATRSDDTEKAVLKRLAVWEETARLVDHYRAQDRLTQVEAAGSVEDVRTRLEAILADL